MTLAELKSGETFMHEGEVFLVLQNRDKVQRSVLHLKTFTHDLLDTDIVVKQGCSLDFTCVVEGCRA
jgi:hypothetical protein